MPWVPQPQNDISVPAITSQPPARGGNQAFTFIGNDAAFTGAAGQVRYATAGYVEGDVNGNAIADLFIAVNPALNPVLNGTDFIL